MFFANYVLRLRNTVYYYTGNKAQPLSSHLWDAQKYTHCGAQVKLKEECMKDFVIERVD